MINLETKQAYSEVNKILELLGNSYSDKIPSKIKEALKKEEDTEYVLDINKSIKERKLKREAIAIISALNLQYWCINEEEKQRLKNIYYENGVKYQEELNEKYNTDNLFKNNNKKTIVENIEEKEMVVYSELPFFKKIFAKIKKFFIKSSI